jgi:hypothetical protein
MQTLNLWSIRLSTFGLALLAGLSLSYWALKWQNAPVVLPTPLTLPVVPRLDAVQLAQLLGASKPSSAAPAVPVNANNFSKYKLLGVIAQGNQGSALIAIDAAPAKPYRVGMALSETLVLHSVSRRGANLAASLNDPVLATLELSPPSSTAPAK